MRIIGVKLNTYGNIPERILDIELTDPNLGIYSYSRSIRDFIDEQGEEIIECDYELGNPDELGYDKLHKFIAWTDSKILLMIDTAIVSVPRNP